MDAAVKYAPLYLHTFRLIAPRKLLEAQRLNQCYHSYREIESIPDRLRWCRHHLGLMQKEVAELIGTTRAIYIDWETGITQHYAIELVAKLAMLYQIPPLDLLDDYNRFLYKGQGEAITRYRTALGLSRKAFAQQLNTDASCIRAWECEYKQISRKSWERYFKGKL